MSVALHKAVLLKGAGKTKHLLKLFLLELNTKIIPSLNIIHFMCVCLCMLVCTYGPLIRDTDPLVMMETSCTHTQTITSPDPAL